MTSKYSVQTLLKAALAFIVALLGSAGAAATEKTGAPDVTTVDFSVWLESLIPALTAGVALLHLPRSKANSAPNAVAAQTVTDVILNATVAHDELVRKAIEGVQAVQKSTGDLTKLIPGGGVLSAVVPGTLNVAEGAILGEAQVAANALGMGPLARQVIGLGRVPRF